MVVIGHSQGGLLSKLISIDSGTKLWDAISEKPVDELDLKPETKAMLKEAVFVHHLPFVRTVIFIATPHGGSYQASLTVVGLFSRLVTLPSTVATATAEILASAGDALKLRTFNSLSGMSPGNPAIEALRKIPMAPGIHAHSIIPTLQDGALEARNDGVVEYTSAHIDGVESELVIEHSGHSTQGNPLTVREVRRILLEELAGGYQRRRTASRMPRRPRYAGRGANANPPPLRRARSSAEAAREHDRPCCGDKEVSRSSGSSPVGPASLCWQSPSYRSPFGVRLQSGTDAGSANQCAD